MATDSWIAATLAVMEKVWARTTSSNVSRTWIVRGKLASVPMSTEAVRPPSLLRLTSWDWMAAQMRLRPSSPAREMLRRKSIRVFVSLGLAVMVDIQLRTSIVQSKRGVAQSFYVQQGKVLLITRVRIVQGPTLHPLGIIKRHRGVTRQESTKAG